MCLDMLENYAFLQLEEEGVAVFQHDSARFHYSNMFVIQLFTGLDEKAQSLGPDTSQFLPLGLCEECRLWVCWAGGQHGRTQTSDHPEMFRYVWDEIEYQMDICHTTKEAHVEIY
jgi:hypothetical protein